MGSKYLGTKEGSLEHSVLDVWQTAVEEQSVREASGDKEAYKKFFDAALKKFDAKSPGEMDDEKKKKFFDYIDKNWEGDDEKKESVQTEGELPPALKKAIAAKKAKKNGDEDDEKKEEKVDESYEMGTDEYRKHSQEITPGQDITDYQRFKVESMKEALAKVWGLDEWISKNGTRKKVSEGDKRRKENKIKSGNSLKEKEDKTATGEKKDEIDLNPKLGEKKD